jgi:membrane associated rhomboid family serine protease
VRAGEVWRVVTALTLHADVGHLLSNLGFGALYGFFAARLIGPGMAWLAILLGGAFGNLANAWLQAPEHRSIGASTAVFAALGLLAAYSLRVQMTRGQSWAYRWGPLIGGIALLGFTGTGGENTDVTAHGTGFVAGAVLGLGASYLGAPTLARVALQRATATLALALVIGAWVVGLWIAGR